MIRFCSVCSRAQALWLAFLNTQHCHKTQVGTIAHLMLEETAKRLALKGVGLQLTESAMARLLSEGYDVEYGARPMRRAVTSLVHDTLSESLLREEVTEGDQVCWSWCDFTFTWLGSSGSGQSGSLERLALGRSRVKSG